MMPDESPMTPEERAFFGPYQGPNGQEVWPISASWGETRQSYLFAGAFCNVEIPKADITGDLPTLPWMDTACAHLWTNYEAPTWENIQTFWASRPDLSRKLRIMEELGDNSVILDA